VEGGGYVLFRCCPQGARVLARRFELRFFMSNRARFEMGGVGARVGSLGNGGQEEEIN
jgi:galactokinase/mevalonate kinase-like predicted kinase